MKRREHQGNAQSWNIVVSFSPHAYEAVVKWHTGQLTTAHLLFLKPISHCSSTLIGLTCSNRLLKMACLYYWVHVRCMSTTSKYQLVVFAYWAWFAVSLYKLLWLIVHLLCCYLEWCNLIFSPRGLLWTWQRKRNMRTLQNSSKVTNQM